MSKEIQIATAESLLGKLQRGRGAGFLAVCHESSAMTWPSLVECITVDPRIDSQVESRADFYAALVIETGMELRPLATHLYEHDDKDQSGRNTCLTVSTLGSLAKRNYGNSVEILRDYVAWGIWWSWAIDELISTKNVDAWMNLDEVFWKRFGNNESVKDELGWFNGNEEPWKTWCEQNVRLRQFADYFREPAKPLGDLDYKSATLADVLQLTEKEADARFNLRRAIKELVKPADFEFLISQVSIAEPKRSTIALAGLTKLANPAMFDWLRDFWSENPEMPRMLRPSIKRAMASLPAKQTLPLARDWLKHNDWHFRILAEDLIKCHATLDDVPLLRHEITLALKDADNQIYRLCNLVGAFKHLPEIGRIPELESVFSEFCYSYGRARAAEALFVVDRDFFIRNYAQECLWDCEDDTRALGCDAVDPLDKVASERLQKLSADVWEDEAVRNAAAKKL